MQQQREVLAHQAEVLVRCEQSEAVLDGILRNDQIRNPNFVDPVAKAQDLHLNDLVPLNRQRTTPYRLQGTNQA